MKLPQWLQTIGLELKMSVLTLEKDQFDVLLVLDWQFVTETEPKLLKEPYFLISDFLNVVG